MKLHRFFAILMMIVLGASFFVACGDINGGVSGNSGDNGSGTNDNGTNVTITETSISICITSYPNKVEYQVNEIFDPTGLVLSAVITERYPDGTEKNITEEIAYPNENITFSGTDFSTEGTKIITVIYTKNEMVKYTSFEVTVGSGSGSLIENTLDSISIKTFPTKTEYKVNEDFDPTGLVLSAVITERYSDGTEKTFTEEIAYPNENISFSGTDFSTAGTKTITVTYTENETSKSATFEITVKAAAFSSTINYTKFDSELNSDLSIYNGKVMTLYLDTTTVNIATLFTQFETLYDAVGENGSVSISYADAANTTIEGELYMNNHLDMNAVNEKRYAHIKSFVDAIKTSVSNNNYPTINMSMTSRTMTDETPFNLYHTGIADLLNLYYNNDMGDKISSFSTSSSAEFDAVDYLNRDERGDLKGKVYDNQEEYIEDSYYNLDVNAALLMNANLKNVNVTGAVSGEKKTFEGTFTNVRFGEDTTGFTFSDSAAGIGLIEFAGDAPSMTPRVDSGRLVIKKVNAKVTTQGGFSIDVSALSADAITTHLAHDSNYFTEAIYGTEEAKDAANYISPSIYVGDNLVTENGDYYATNQQWVKAANENKWKGYNSDASLKYPDTSLISKAKIDEKNNTLLNTILFNNQKVYNS